jgi:hypothetical protein
MERFLFKIEHVFELSGRGCVIVPRVKDSSIDVRINQQIQLRTPDVRRLDSYVGGLEILCGKDVHQHWAVLLPAEIRKQDIPAGTEVWLR